MRRPQRVWNCTQGVIHVQRLNLLGLLGEEKAQHFCSTFLRVCNFTAKSWGLFKISDVRESPGLPQFLKFFPYSRAKFGLSSPEEEWNIWLSLFVSSQHLRKVSIPFYWFYWTQCDRCRNSSTPPPKKYSPSNLIFWLCKSSLSKPIQ